MWSLPNILTVIFVLCKLFGVIDWSWWIVFAPTLISIGIGIGFLVILFLGFLFVELKK